MKHIHLIGIGGTGLSAIALLLKQRGYIVSGSDRTLSPLARTLSAQGVTVYAGHDAQNVPAADLVVRSSAIPDDNPEVLAALAAGIPVLKRAEFLGQMMDGYRTIAIAGTHGKTTTTAMVAWIFTRLDQDPSYIIGGVAKNLGNNAHAGSGPLFVIEADEYDNMFLGLTPHLEVICTLEHDHPDLFPTPESYNEAFIRFVNRLEPEGVLLVCADDKGASWLGKNHGRADVQCLTYGIRADSDYRAEGLTSNSHGGFDFDAVFHDELLAKVSLQVPGEHNALNAMAALAVAHSQNLSLDQVAEALAEFEGTGRRFEVLGEAHQIIVVDDYAHHPTEVRATLAAARARYPGHRIWAVWQPHTFSRTITLLDDFVAALALADRVVVTEVYASREHGQGFSSAAIVEAMVNPSAYFAPTLPAATEYLLEQLQPGDVLLVLSAGDADQISAAVFAELRSVEDSHG
ncbi:MAG TPA: UDP-N-acetylmuramate--L-alanine ligase [Bellilinea sp.]|nr:UDP-N-acetylmuramate--L-alanine ligase [Bellilinea sp.]